jgi:hypothetical protein
VICNILIGSTGKFGIHIEPLIDGLTDRGAKLVGIRNVESSLNYKKQTRLISNETAEECRTHLSNVNWE